MNLFELTASLSMDITDFTDKASNAEESGKSLAKTLGADMESIRKAFTDAFSVSVGQLMADGFKQALGFTTEFVKESVEVASNMEEIRNKVDTIFKGQADEVYNWAASAKESFGMSEGAALDYVSTLASIMKATGIEEAQILPISMELIARTADIASFLNLSYQEVYEKLKSGLRGETEAVEALGLSVHVATMVEWLGLEKETDFTKKMSQAEQWMARYQYLMEQTDYMSGDFSRTSGSYANQMKILSSNIEELQKNIGEGLIPVMNKLLGFVNGLFDSEESVSEETNELNKTFVESFTAMNDAAKNALNLIETLERLENDGIDTPTEFAKWVSVLEQLQDILPGVNDLIDDQTGAIAGGTKALREHLDQQLAYDLDIASSKIKAEYYDKYARQLIETQKAEMAYDIRKQEAEKAKSDIYKIQSEAFDYWKENTSNWQTIMTAEGQAYDQNPFGTLRSWLMQMGGPVAETYASMMRDAENKASEVDSAIYKIETDRLWNAYLEEQKKLDEYERGVNEIEAIDEYIRKKSASTVDTSIGSSGISQTDETKQMISLMNQYAEELLDASRGSGAKPWLDEKYASVMDELKRPSNEQMLAAWLQFYEQIKPGEENIDFGFDIFKLGPDGRMLFQLPPEVTSTLTNLPDAIAGSLSGLQIVMDGTVVGNLVTPTVSANMSRAARGKLNTSARSFGSIG